MTLGFTYGRLLPLTFFESLFERGGFAKVLGQDRLGHVVPEPLTLVGKLQLFGGDDLRDRVQRREIHEEMAALDNVWGSTRCGEIE